VALVVEHGSGSGRFPPGTLVHIWADPPPPGEVFDRWTGDLDALIDRYAAHTTLVMPAGPLKVKAAFKHGATCEPATETLHGTAVTWCVPAAHSAVILLFHGTAGDGLSFFRSTEPGRFVREAAAAGFALVALDSADRTSKTWQLKVAGPNPDVENVRAALAELTRRGLLLRQEPLYALGVAQGGNFGARLANHLGFRAAAIFGAAGKLPPDYSLPTMWLMTQSTFDRTPAALADYNRLLKSQVTAKLVVNDPSPVHPLRFWGAGGLSPDDSRAIHRLLQDRGFLDAHDMLKDDPETSGWEDLLPPRLARVRGVVREELDVCFAVPRFFSDFDHRILEFFNEHR
jgi:hypothetical protein